MSLLRVGLCVVSLLVIIIACHPGAGAVEFEIVGQEYRTDSFQRAQEQALFTILVPDFNILSDQEPGASQQGKGEIIGTLRKFQNKGSDQGVFVDYAMILISYEIPGKFIAVSLTETNNPILVLPDPRLNRQLKVIETKGIPVLHSQSTYSWRTESETHQGVIENFQFRCGEVHVSLRLWGQDLTKGLRLIESMLPAEC